MKKLMYLAAALLVMAGCKNNQNEPEAPIQGEAFQKGEKVTITIGEDQVKAPVRKVNGTVTSTGIDFTWEANDSLFITVGSNTAIFRLTKGAGTANGTFEGKMPAGGETFTAEYRGQYANNLTSYTNSQSYTENGIDMDFIHAQATDCSVSNSTSSINLVVDNAAAVIFNLQCDKLLKGLKIAPYFGDLAPARKAKASFAYMTFGTSGLQLSASTPTKVALLLPTSFLSQNLDAEFEWNVTNDDTHAPYFSLDGVTAGDAVNYPLKKWINMTLPSGAKKTKSVQLCAVGEKTTWTFWYERKNITNTKFTLKVGTHTIFSKYAYDLCDGLTGEISTSQTSTFYDTADGNTEYKVKVDFNATTHIVDFTITSNVSEFALNNSFEITEKKADIE